MELNAESIFLPSRRYKYASTAEKGWYFHD